MATFVAVDGEAIDGRYVLLARDSGDHVLDMDGLGTLAVFDWLLSIPKAKGQVVVCFGLNYDVNNWLKDLPTRKLAELWANHRCYWRGHRIEWLPGRWFSVKRAGGPYVQVCECFGFFQQSFVGALREWGFDPPPELAAMKGKRGTFTHRELRRVTDYCVAECRLLRELMGALAGAVLNANGVSDHHAYDLDLTTEQVATDVVCGAYFGGRIELLRQGEFNRAHTADLRSAYPAAIAQLPSLTGARLVHRKRYDPNAKHAIWRVSWECPPGTLVAPFPVRQDFSIFYPLAGTGCYHAAEVAAAIAAGYPVTVIEGWVLKHPAGRPFSWVPALYRKRAAMKRAGDPAQRALKLGLNSCYGKLAQGVGYQSRPPWQSYMWAGEVTAITRAALLGRVSRTPDRAIMLSTDGVFATHPSRCRKDDRLGSWEAGQLDELFAAQPGVYQGYHQGAEVIRSRGFFARDIDYDQLRDGWLTEGPDYVHVYQSTRFIGMGAALARGRMELWREWVTEPRSLALMPERKRLVNYNGTGTYRLLPPPGPMVSEPYVPKQTLLDGRALDYLEGMEQPMRQHI